MNYGNVIEKATGGKLISYTEFGSYQGDYIAALENGYNIELWKGGYGSCSGCDWLENKRSLVDYSNDFKLSSEQAREYLGAEKPFAIIPKETMERVDLDTFITFLPANTRANIYKFEPYRLFNDIKESLKNHELQ